jgi:hypothetical protein
MKRSRKDVRTKAAAIPQLKFEDQRLTSFAGLVVFQKLFQVLNLKARLERCFRHQSHGKVFQPSRLFLQLIVHLLLGFRELRHADYYREDPLVQRVLGFDTLPDVATLSRMLKDADSKSIEHLRALLGDMVLERMASHALPRITLDFDGSVQSTKRKAQGAAVGFNKKKKGARSYYPLFCTVAQTGQVLNFVHRSGNVHDSNGARAFILECVAQVRSILPGAIIEVRMDSAFFSDEIVAALDKQHVEFTISVPFERFVELKKMIEGRQRWYRIDDDRDYFETEWKPKSWPRKCRFIMVRTLSKKQQKGPVQLDLFEPYEYGFDFKVIVTNKQLQAAGVVDYHDGRGSQEGVFAELKSHCHVDYVPVRTKHGNETYLLAGLFAFNLTRELQMKTQPPKRSTTRQRSTLWIFEQVDTLRKTILQRAGRISRPAGTLTLTFCSGKSLKERVLGFMQSLDTAA